MFSKNYSEIDQKNKSNFKIIAFAILIEMNNMTTQISIKSGFRKFSEEFFMEAEKFLDNERVSIEDVNHFRSSMKNRESFSGNFCMRNSPLYQKRSLKKKSKTAIITQV